MSDKKRFLLTVGLIVSLFLSPLTLTAQTSATNDWAAVRNIPTDSKIQVKLKTGKTIDGKLGSVSDSTLTLSKKSPLEVKREDVQSVYQIISKSATASTLIGLGVGAGAGAGIGAIAGANDDSGFEKIDHAATAGLAVVGAVVGAVTGYLIGRKSNKRVLVYESR